jgi:hypothetical protein
MGAGRDRQWANGERLDFGSGASAGKFCFKAGKILRWQRL